MNGPVKKTVSLCLLTTMLACGDGPVAPVRSAKPAAFDIELEGITATVSPTTRTPGGELQCTDPVMCGGSLQPATENPLAGYGGGTYGSGTSGLPGDEDGDGDTHDEGPIAYVGCVAAKLGISGFAMLLASGHVAYQLHGARGDVRDSYNLWQLYTAYPRGESYNEAIAFMYEQRYRDALKRESDLWQTLGVVGGPALILLGAALWTCSPIGAAPTP